MNKDQVYYAKKYKQHGRANRSCVMGGIWFDTQLNRYVRISRPSYSKYLKKECNNKLRGYEIEHSSQMSYYRKLADYWYDLY